MESQDFAPENSIGGDQRGVMVTANYRGQQKHR